MKELMRYLCDIEQKPILILLHFAIRNQIKRQVFSSGFYFRNQPSVINRYMEEDQYTVKAELNLVMIPWTSPFLTQTQSPPLKASIHATASSPSLPLLSTSSSMSSRSSCVLSSSFAASLATCLVLALPCKFQMKAYF